MVLPAVIVPVGVLALLMDKPAHWMPGKMSCGAVCPVRPRAGVGGAVAGEFGDGG